MPKILVTGGHGFIGVPLCNFLVEQGLTVVAGSSRTVSADRGAPLRAHLPLLREIKQWKFALRDVACVVHLAAYVHQMGRDGEASERFEQINAAGSRFVAERAVEAGVSRFVFLSTVKVNGEGREGTPYTAVDVPHPQDAYGRSKLSAELAIRDVCVRNGMEFVIIRSPLVYGPGVRANFLRLVNMVRSGLPLPLASVSNRRSLIGVDNLVDFIATCILHRKAPDKVWLVADAEVVSTPDLIRMLADAMGVSARLFHCPPSILRAFATGIGLRKEFARLLGSLTVDASPATRILGWKPPISLDEGLRKAAIGGGWRKSK